MCRVRFLPISVLAKCKVGYLGRHLMSLDIVLKVNPMTSDDGLVSTIWHLDIFELEIDVVKPLIHLRDWKSEGCSRAVMDAVPEFDIRQNYKGDIIGRILAVVLLHQNCSVEFLCADSCISQGR